jgi:hypothetical protein
MHGFEINAIPGSLRGFLSMRAYRRIGVYFRAEGGWQMDAQIAQL